MRTIAEGFKTRLAQHRNRAVRPLTPTMEELKMLDKEVVSYIVIQFLKNE